MTRTSTQRGPGGSRGGVRPDGRVEVPAKTQERRGPRGASPWATAKQLFTCYTNKGSLSHGVVVAHFDLPTAESPRSMTFTTSPRAATSLSNSDASAAMPILRYSVKGQVPDLPQRGLGSSSCTSTYHTELVCHPLRKRWTAPRSERFALKHLQTLSTTLPTPSTQNDAAPPCTVPPAGAKAHSSHVTHSAARRGGRGGARGGGCG